MKSILIVDDQAGIRLLLDELFRKEGYETRLAGNGLEAIQAVREEIPGCILLDTKMPGMDGIETLEQLEVLCPEVPVIMMTAYEESELPQGSARRGKVLYFAKPFDIYEIRNTVNGLLLSDERTNPAEQK
ncbi:sporulation initiation phosphotransferase f [Bacillus sp. OxB-1]|uniref:response regulator n=1 Tax=Bacillus sp. (strain OxB-1) TaxID=98228 RepID=UPI000581EF20|nr:response regulator [Bacillus sp. OxB-1]BAQ09884.1 sporulation initiation phosphotransferase f [Bacillus sp. OxB-1]